MSESFVYEGKTYVRTARGWLDGCYLAKPEMARRLEKAYAQSLCAGRGFDDLYAEAVRANQAGNPAAAQQICLELLERSGVTAQQARGPLSTLIACTRDQVSGGAATAQIIGYADKYAERFGADVLGAPVATALAAALLDRAQTMADGRLFDKARADVRRAGEVLRSGTRGRQRSEYDWSVYHRLKKMEEELGR